MGKQRTAGCYGGHGTCGGNRESPRAAGAVPPRSRFVRAGFVRAGLQPYRYLAYDAIIAERAAKKTELPRVIRKFTLPVSQAAELMRLVASQGVDAASMFPGYAGVAESLMERDLWLDPTSQEPESTARRAGAVRRAVGTLA